MDDYEIKDPVIIEDKVLRKLLDENKRFKETVHIKEGLLLNAAEDIEEYEKEYKRLYEEVERLREENRRIKQRIKENTGVDIDEWGVR